jgi:hypothetical protein
MPEFAPLEIALLAGVLVLGIALGWILRAGRCAKEKIAINAGWQEQFEAQRLHNRIEYANRGDVGCAQGIFPALR